MSDFVHDAAENWPTMPYSTRSPKDAERYRRFNELRAQTGDTMAVSYTHLTLPTNREV